MERQASLLSLSLLIFFLHMNNPKNFNLINKYSKAFESSVLSARLGVMVPFP